MYQFEKKKYLLIESSSGATHYATLWAGRITTTTACGFGSRRTAEFVKYLVDDEGPSCLSCRRSEFGRTKQGLVEVVVE